MPDGYVTGSGKMSYCNQTPFPRGSGHETTREKAPPVDKLWNFWNVHLILVQSKLSILRAVTNMICWSADLLICKNTAVRSMCNSWNLLIKPPGTCTFSLGHWPLVANHSQSVTTCKALVGRSTFGAYYVGILANAEILVFTSISCTTESAGYGNTKGRILLRR